MPETASLFLVAKCRIKKNITNALWIKKKMYFCRLFEVECKGGWKTGFEPRN